MRRHYTKEFKQQIVNLYEKGNLIKNICCENDVTKSALYNWIKQYGKPAKSKTKISNLQYKINVLEKKLSLLTIENEILKKSKCNSNSSINEKIEAIISLKNEYSIHDLCRLLEVRRSIYYHYEKKPALTLFEKENDILY